MNFDGINASGYLRNHALVEAICWMGHNYNFVHKWVMQWDMIDPGIHINEDGTLEVTNFHGSAIIEKGDWLVRDISNELFYRAAADVFTATYKAT